MVNLFWLSLALATQEDFSLPIFPPPRQVEVLGSSWQLQLPIRVEAPETLQRPAELLRKELRSLFGEKFETRSRMGTIFGAKSLRALAILKSILASLRR
jgi:hypothetical protein